MVLNGLVIWKRRWSEWEEMKWWKRRRADLNYFVWSCIRKKEWRRFWSQGKRREDMKRRDEKDGGELTFVKQKVCRNLLNVCFMFESCVLMRIYIETFTWIYAIKEFLLLTISTCFSIHLSKSWSYESERRSQECWSWVFYTKKSFKQVSYMRSRKDTPNLDFHVSSLGLVRLFWNEQKKGNSKFLLVAW